MLKFIILVVCYILHCAALNPSTNTENESQHKHLNRAHLLTEIDPKSIGATPVAITSTSWQVSVRLKTYEEIQFGYGHICGGAVITRQVVVSAAHCALRSDVTPAVYRNPNEFKLVMGSVYLYEITPFTLQLEVLEIVPHSDFKLQPRQNDIALYFMVDLIPANHPTIAPISLSQATVDSNQNCTVTGWGITENGTNWPVLLRAVVPIIEMDRCNASYGGNITRGMICAGYTSAGGMNACQGDLGGPLACNKDLVGIVSWGKRCEEPEVYTKIADYSSWIQLTNSNFNTTHYGGAAGLVVDQRPLVWAIIGVLISLTWMKVA